MARRTFFSFHYQPDVWRAWNVRNSWVVRASDQISVGFFDGSVFEASKKESEQSLKNFLRDGLDNTSVTCVLAGTDTWNRRWVRYEIARSVVKGNGILALHIHGVKNKDGQTTTRGTNPLTQIGVYKTDSGIYLAERDGDKWIKYEDYKLAIPSEKIWFPAPTNTTVVQLATYCKSYDFIADDGRNKIGGWIELAAKNAGR